MPLDQALTPGGDSVVAPSEPGALQAALAAFDSGPVRDVVEVTPRFSDDGFDRIVHAEVSVVSMGGESRVLVASFD